MDNFFWMDKEVYVTLKNGKVYQGKVIDVSFIGRNKKDQEFWILTIIDKYGHYIAFDISEIVMLKEEFRKKEGDIKNGNK